MGQSVVQVEEDDRADEGGTELNQPPPHGAQLVGLAEVAAKNVVPALADPSNDQAEEDREPEEDHKNLEWPGPGKGVAQAHHQEDVTKEVKEKEEEI